MEQNKVSGKKTVLLIFAVLAVIITGCVIAVSAYVKKTVGETPESESAKSAYTLPSLDSKAAAADYITQLFSGISDINATALKKDVSVSVNTDSLKYSGTETGRTLVAHVLPSYLDSHKELLRPGDSVFGERDGALALPAFPVKDFSYEQGEKKDENDNGDRYGYLKISLSVPEDLNACKQLSGCGFLFADADSFFKEALEGGKEMFNVTGSSIRVLSSDVQIKTDLKENRADEIKVNTVFHAEILADFTGDYEKLGTQMISFDFTAEEKYTAKYAGIEIKDDEMTFKPGEKEMPEISAVLNDDAKDTDYTLTFASENTEYVTVDDEFSITALKPTEKPVTVTATLTYLGRTYTDEIKITVKEGK